MTDLIQFPATGSLMRARGEESAGEDASRGTFVGVGHVVRNGPVHDRQPGSRIHQQLRYVVERGSGSSGTAYNKRDHEVLDLAAKAGSRIVCRATSTHAHLIARALNQLVE